MRNHEQSGVWSKTAEESSPWLRLLALLRRDRSRQVRRSSYVAVTAPTAAAAPRSGTPTPSVRP